MFMAADLVEDPTIQQTFAHDLESFFWLLLWMVLKYMETSWEEGRRSHFLKTIFTPELDKVKGGVTGGRVKKGFMREELDKEDFFQITKNPILTDFLIRLKDIVSSCYDKQPSIADLGQDEYKFKCARYTKRLGFMENHDKMLDEFAVDHPWPTDDKAIPQGWQQSICVSIKTQTAPKRSRSTMLDDVSMSSKRHKA
ncbi:hypothetical protein BGY98DRAFT_1022397 [Russula aff. rugulosa BPL654]|nr:hypothetical protein BGY98DRAFT_1022397 [Russula aff. rugulosa BPL654]